jgi:hypothetical protein
MLSPSRRGPCGSAGPELTDYALVPRVRYPGFPLVAGSGFVFEDTGEHELKGVPDRWQLYRVVSERT